MLAANAFSAQRVASMRRATVGAAFCAARVRGSDQHRNGTQDVNDPVYGPATRPTGCSGSFTSWVPRVCFAAKILRLFRGGNSVECRAERAPIAHVLSDQNAALNAAL
jgi:hypothetical protein